MTDYPIADFDRFRFFRDSEENIVSLEAQTFGEQLLPVLDCEYFRIARLHVYDRAALKSDWLEAFDVEMELLSEIEEPAISSPFTWGRDDDELFYVNDFFDGEGLPDYLKREGAQSRFLAARWLLPFVELIDGREENPMSILRFSNMNLQVVRNLESNDSELHFTEFTAWTKPGNLVVERGPEYFLAQSFCSLISGVPIRDFTEESVPRQFYDLSKKCRRAVLATFDAKPGKARDAFFDEIRELAGQKVDEEELVAPQPRSQLRAWIREEHAGIPELSSLPVLEEKAEAEADLSYASEAEEGELPTLLQFYPGIATIPREGWFEQHWISLRRQGRTFVNQLAVHEVLEHKSISVINEENPNGIHLRRLVRETGPLDLDHAVAMARKLSSSLDGLESSTAAVPVWFLPEQNVFLNFGTRDAAEFKSAIETSGPDFWERIPFRLRLHQTMLGLLDGINFPKSLRSNAFELAKENPHIRRTAVLLPLICLMLSGKRFDWDEEFTLEGIDAPEGLIDFINKVREQLLDKPLLLELGFLNRLSDFQVPPNPDDQWDHDTYEKEVASSGIPRDTVAKLPELNLEKVEPDPEEEAVTEEETPEEAKEEITEAGEMIQARAREENDHFKNILSEKLGSDSITLPKTAESQPSDPDEKTETKKAAKKTARNATPSVKKKGIATKRKSGAASKKSGKGSPSGNGEKADKKSRAKARKETAAARPARKEGAKASPATGTTKREKEEAEPDKDFNPIAAGMRRGAGKKDDAAEKKDSPGEDPHEVVNPIAKSTKAPAKKTPQKKAAPAKEPAPPKAGSNTEVFGPEAKRGGLAWIWIILAALVLGGGVGFYLDGQAKHAGLYAVENEIEFPRSEYRQVAPKVNPFTNEVEVVESASVPPPIEVLSEVSDLGTAIAKSNLSIEEQKYSRAVDLALWGLQLSPDSVEAGAQLETALEAWIESGIDVPARTDDPAAVSVLAEYYIKNRPSEGLYILFGSARQENPGAMRILGVLFGQGNLVPKSPSIAERWLRKAAELGDQDARFYFGESSVFGTLVKPNSEGFSFVELAADAGHARSLLLRGYCSLEGRGVEKNETNGYRYILRAAEKNSLEALYLKGLCNAGGIGTERNAFATASAFKTAADLGHVAAMYRYAQCLIAGFGIPQSYAEGVSWMKKAAAAGHFEARDWCSRHQAEFEPITGP